jgi:hypothetical protein
MSSVIQSLKRLVHLLYERIWSWLSTAPPGSLELTGVLGAAALLVSYYHLKRQNQPREPPAGQQQQQQTSQQQQQRSQQQGASSRREDSSAAGHGCAPPGPKPSSSAAPTPSAAVTPLGQAVRSALAGATRVTLSAAGVLTEEWDAADWTEGATLRPGVAELLRELARAADVYVIAHVADDVGQALVTGALEAADLLGPGPGQVRPHKLLFCSTLEGKVSLVRQLEPHLHMDAAAATLEGLRRFMPRLLHVVAPGGRPLAAPNITSATSLAAFCGQV